MWKLVILASAAVSIFGNPTGPELFRLSAPYNLRTGNESETSVVLRWHFDKPKDIPLSDVRFRIRLDQWPQAISFPYEDAPLNFTLNHLLPGESYTAYLVALCAYCHDSPPVNISFTTMEKDWPTPIITNVTLSSSEDAENGVSYYEVMWEELPQRWLFYIKIEICDPACIEYTEEPTANSTFVPVKSFTVFTVRLCAVYNEMVVGRIKRCSIYFQAFPDTPVAKAILRWASVSRPMISGPKSTRNTYLLPKGTRTYYEFLVCDPSLQSKEPNARTIPVGSTTSSPELIQAEERVRIIDPGLLQRLSSLSYSDQACQLDEQVQFKIARRTQKAKRFRIVFETHTAVWFDLENKAQRLLLAPGFAKTLNLAPFKPINFLIRNCLFHPKLAVNNCGNYTASDIVSTVAEPSVVQEAKRTLVARGLLAISWQEPAEPRGPIHGYKIEFRRKIGGQITRKFEFVVPTQRSLLFPLPMGGAEIWISVAAFNLDIDDKTEMLLGEWVNAGPEESRYYPMIVVVVLSVVLPVMLFGGIEYYFAKLRSRRRLHQISVPVQRFGRDFDATAFPEEMHVIRTPPVRFRQAPHQAPIAEEESSL